MRKTKNQQRAQIKKHHQKRRKSLILTSAVWNNKNLTLTQTVHARWTPSVKRKPNKVMKNRWEKNNKDIRQRLNNTNSITHMIKRAKWAKSHNFRLITWNSNQNQSHCQSRRLWEYQWKKLIVKFSKKTKSRNKLNLWWGLLYKAMQNTWLKSQRSSSKPEKQQSTWFVSFSTNNNSSANGNWSCSDHAKWVTP